MKSFKFAVISWSIVNYSDIILLIRIIHAKAKQIG